MTSVLFSTHGLCRATAVLVLLCALALSGCALRNTSLPRHHIRAADPAVASDAPAAPNVLSGEDYDPWECFNELSFSFNFDLLDGYALARS